MVSYDGSGSGVHPPIRAGPKTWPAVCIDCGQECRVPFDPAGQKPRCPDCFKAKKAAMAIR